MTINRAVLIADSDKDWQATLTETLNGEFIVKSVSSLEQALQALAQRDPPISAVITESRLISKDIVANEEFALLRHIKSKRLRTKAIVLTQDPSIPKATKALREFGAYDYLEKYPSSGSFNSEQIKEAVRNAVKEANNCDVFVLMSFAEDFSAIYDVIRDIIEDERIGLVCRRADDLFIPDVVLNNILDYIHEARFIIADLSGKRPSVTFEVGIAHAVTKSVVLLAQSEEEVCPMLGVIRFQLYTNDFKGAKQLQLGLQRIVSDLQRHGYPTVFSDTEWNVNPNLCLAIAPNTRDGRRAYEQIIQPVAKAADLDCICSTDIYGDPIVLEDIWKQINRARLVIVDLSDPNNLDIFYMSGLAYGLEKNIIYLASENSEIPFDLRPMAPIRYSYENSFETQKILGERIKSLLERMGPSVTQIRSEHIAGVWPKLERLDIPQFERFCMDYFPEVQRRFTRDSLKNEKIDLLLKHCRNSNAAFQRLDSLLDQYIREIGCTVALPPENSQVMKSKKRTLETAHRALAILEEQVAGFTSLTVPPHLVIELENKRKEVAQLENEIKLATRPDHSKSK